MRAVHQAEERFAAERAAEVAANASAGADPAAAGAAGAAVEAEAESQLDAVLGGELVIPGRVWNRLFPYQRTCVKWLWELHKQGVGGIVADEMGLGKVCQLPLLPLRWRGSVQVRASLPTATSLCRRVSFFFVFFRCATVRACFFFFVFFFFLSSFLSFSFLCTPLDP